MSRLQRQISEAIRDGLSDFIHRECREGLVDRSVYTREFSDQAEFNQFVMDVANIQKWKCVLWDLDQKFRSEIKYNCNPRTVEETEVWQQARDLLRSLLREEGLDLG